jgi:hypothetical protein
MNAATAHGLLGGDVSAKFLPDTNSKDAGNCEFARTSDARIKLRIEVTVLQWPAAQFGAFVAKCGSSGNPLKAIGNEAVGCTSGREQRVIARVRDRVFVITLLPSETATADAARQAVRKAAEMVAGNLF